LFGDDLNASHQYIRTGSQLAHLPLLGRPIKRTETRTNWLKPPGMFDVGCQANVVVILT
jgi:hypothetical protein